MAALTLNVPRINDNRPDFNTLTGLWRDVMGAGDGVDVEFDFTHCDFLRPNALVFLGGLTRLIWKRGGTAHILVETLQEKVRVNLLQNGFAHAMGSDALPWQGNAIPYREYSEQDKNTIVRNLKEDWLGRGWISISPALVNEITGQMWEIFANAFEHGRSPVGICCCGQHLPRQGELLLAVADFGVGIPSNVQLFHNPRFTAADSMRWAFERGMSTARQSNFARGMGLDLLKEFIRASGGRMEVFSHDGYARVDAQGERYETLPSYFQGTLAQVCLRCDDRYYRLSNERHSTPFF